MLRLLVASIDSTYDTPSPAFHGTHRAMSKLEFKSNSKPTVGIEIEVGLVDVETMKLSNSIEPLLQRLNAPDHPSFKPEFMQSFIEVNTDVCDTVRQAETDLRAKLTQLEQAADEIGLRLWWGGTHPFSNWREQKVTENERYHSLCNLLQEMARRMVTFGLHVHVGVDSGDKAIMICDRIMQHLPTLLALSCSSPFWGGRDTGLHSNRIKIIEGLPTAGLPPHMRNWSEYAWLVRHMIDTNFIHTIREIWWDVRPHHNFGTVEVRVCDMPGNLADSLGLAALIQCLVKDLSDLIDDGTYQLDCHPMMVRLNKWRACRYGNKANLVNSYSYAQQTIPQIVDELVRRLWDTAQDLECAEYLERLRAMSRAPSWSERQVMLLKELGSPKEMVSQLTLQSRISQPVGA